MKKKGFTLIELLAVIVILAIIALITIPLITDIINKTRMNAFKDSAYGIIKAGELYYSTKNVLGEDLNEETFIFPDNIKELPIKGKLPSSGNMKINKDGEIALALSNGRYCITKDYEDTEVTVTEDFEECIIPVIEYALGDPVFFNPVENRLCDEKTEYSSSNSQTGVKTGCMRWYVYKLTENQVGLILDHNTTGKIEWINASDYTTENNKDEIPDTCNYTACNDEGPVTLMKQLKEDTEDQEWKVKADIIDALDILNLLPWYENNGKPEEWEEQYVTDMGNIANTIFSTIQANSSNYANTLEMHKAMTNMLMTDYSDIALPSYLHEDLYDNCSSDGTCTTYGYWTKTAHSIDSSSAWLVFNGGFLDSSFVNDDDGCGVRPVINLSKSLISQ